MISPPPPSRTAIQNVVFTIPRTSSHLLLQILNLPSQQSIQRHSSDGYFFLGPLVQRFIHNIAGKPVSTWSPQSREAVKASLQKSYTSFEAFLDEAAARGKNTFVKEHINWMLDPHAETRCLYPSTASENSSSTPEFKPSLFVVKPAHIPHPTHSPANETALPDEVLRSLRPTFLIRNPMLTFPSLLRTGIDNEGLDAVLQGEETQKWEMTFHWSKALYEFYVSSSVAPGNLDNNTSSISQSPIILDADDILSPRLMSHYASTIGLDPELIRYEWSAASADEVRNLGKVQFRMKDTLLKSEGIVKGKTAEGLVLEDEVEKWKREFGSVLAGRLEHQVRDSMADYEWLWERRLKV